MRQVDPAQCDRGIARSRLRDNFPGGVQLWYQAAQQGRGRPPKRCGLDLPGLPPSRQAERTGQRDLRAGAVGSQVLSGRGAGARRSGQGRIGGPDGLHPGPAFRGAEAEGGSRQGDSRLEAPPSGRRAHRKSRHQERRGGHRSVSPAMRRGGYVGPDGDSRPRAGLHGR